MFVRKTVAVDAAGCVVTTAESRCNQYVPLGLSKVRELYRNSFSLSLQSPFIPLCHEFPCFGGHCSSVNTVSRGLCTNGVAECTYHGRLLWPRTKLRSAVECRRVYELNLGVSSETVKVRDLLYDLGTEGRIF
jgi:hypothetical protein